MHPHTVGPLIGQGNAHARVCQRFVVIGTNPTVGVAAHAHDADRAT